MSNIAQYPMQECHRYCYTDLTDLASSGRLGGREVKTSAVICRKSWVRILPKSPVEFWTTDTQKAQSIYCTLHRCRESIVSTCGIVNLVDELNLLAFWSHGWFKGSVTSRSERTLNWAWNWCPGLRWTQWLKITGSFMQQQR